MPEEEKKAAPEEEAGAETAEADVDAIAEIVQSLLDNGLSADQVMGVVSKAVDGGDLPPEAIDVAKELLAADEQEGQKLFGLDK